ncbi:MAG: GNAT family N-acetyltransferase [Gemmatimonadaceae bacterium]
MTILQTERLVLRPLTLDDLDWFSVLRGDPDVMRYIGTHGPLTPEQSVEKLDKYLRCWTDNGLGMFGIRCGDEPVGWGGLQPLENTGEIEVGYAFGKKSWGLGLATETARAVVAWGFLEKQLDRIVAVASPENSASRRVMDKLGMTYEGLKFRYGTDCAYHSLTRADFAANEARRGGAE